MHPRYLLKFVNVTQCPVIIGPSIDSRVPSLSPHFPAASRLIQLHLYTSPRHFPYDRSERDRTIKCIRKPSVSSTDHHSADDELAEHCEVTTQTGQVRWISKRKSDIAVCRNDFEEDREDRECLFGQQCIERQCMLM